MWNVVRSTLLRNDGPVRTLLNHRGICTGLARARSDRDEDMSKFKPESVFEHLNVRIRLKDDDHNYQLKIGGGENKKKRTLEFNIRQKDITPELWASVKDTFTHVTPLVKEGALESGVVKVEDLEDINPRKNRKKAAQTLNDISRPLFS